MPSHGTPHAWRITSLKTPYCALPNRKGCDAESLWPGVWLVLNSMTEQRRGTTPDMEHTVSRKKMLPMRSHWQTWGRFRGVAGWGAQKWGKGKQHISRVKLVHYLCLQLILYLTAITRGEYRKYLGEMREEGVLVATTFFFFFNKTLHLTVAVDFCNSQLMFFSWSVHSSRHTVNPIKLSLVGHWTSLCFHINICSQSRIGQIQSNVWESMLFYTLPCWVCSTQLHSYFQTR